jgi:1-acyl-sn-glycerol-3-phosphate acyltransferase
MLIGGRRPLTTWTAAEPRVAASPQAHSSRARQCSFSWNDAGSPSSTKRCSVSPSRDTSRTAPAAAPDAPAIVLPKHQSTWETFWLPSFLPRDLTFVYKRELNLLPFFGWGIASTQMISIDRSKGQDAFEQVVEQGADRLGRGWWIVIFPEGTRTRPGSTRRYKTGGPRLAVRTGALALPIAVNSGECWPKNGLLRPGVITVSIGKPIDPKGKSPEEVGALVESWIETEMRRLAPHRYSGPYQPAARGGAVPAPQD